MVNGRPLGTRNCEPGRDRTICGGMARTVNVAAAELLPTSACWLSYASTSSEMVYASLPGCRLARAVIRLTTRPPTTRQQQLPDARVPGRPAYKLAGMVTVVLLRRSACVTLAFSMGLPGPASCHVKRSVGDASEQPGARLTIAVTGSARPAVVPSDAPDGSVTLIGSVQFVATSATCKGTAAATACLHVSIVLHRSAPLAQWDLAYRRTAPAARRPTRHRCGTRA